MVGLARFGHDACRVRPRKHIWKVGVAKVAPGEFIKQVQAETRKVVWPTRRETTTTAIFVAILATVLAIFFGVVDWAFSRIVELLLSLASA
jgi:preprotein translocase subunit SecE